MTRVEIGGGWDGAAAVVDDEWLERTARRPDVETGLRTETRLLPWLAPRLPFADAVRAAYRPTDEVIARAADWHGVGPFYEVEFGLDTGDRTLVASGRRGIVERLVTASDR